MPRTINRHRIGGRGPGVAIWSRDTAMPMNLSVSDIPLSGSRATSTPYGRSAASNRFGHRWSCRRSGSIWSA